MANKVEVKKENEVDINKELLERFKDLEAKLEALREEKVTPTTFVGKINETSKASPLMPGKKITIVPIKRTATNFIPKDADQATMLKGTGRGIRCPMHSKMNKLIDPLTPEEREYLEEVLGLNLDIYSKDSDGYTNCFYSKREAEIRFKKNGRTIESASVVLDLGDPYEFLLYKIALVNSRVAVKYADRNVPHKEFVIMDEVSQLAEDIDYSEKEDKVNGYLLTIKSNKKALYDLIRLYGNTNAMKLKVTRDNSMEWLYNELKKVSRTIAGVRNLYNIIKLNDSSPIKLTMMTLIEDALECGVIERRGNEYKLDGGDPIGYNMEEAIAFLNNREHQNIKLRVVNTVENYLKQRK